MRRLKYQKPQIKVEKIKLNSFLGNSRAFDSFQNLGGSLFAQTSDCSGCTNGGEATTYGT
jgi:hypothetical protein